MISNETQEKLVERLTNRIEQLNEVIIKEIGSKLKYIGTLTPTQAFQIQQILKYRRKFRQNSRNYRQSNRIKYKRCVRDIRRGS